MSLYGPLRLELVLLLALTHVDKSEYVDKVINTICMFQNACRGCFLTSFVLCGLLRSYFTFCS